MGKLQATKNKRHSVTQAKQAKGAETTNNNQKHNMTAAPLAYK